MYQNEYEWVRQTRETLLDFCRELEPNDFTRQNGFAWQNVRDSLVHIADCYYAWLGSFVLLKTNKPLTPKENLHNLNLNDIKIRFEQVDTIVYEVFKLHGNQLNEPIERKIPWRDVSEKVSFTPGKLLMHTITHEFHHKGQIVAMIRQMGYEPPYTDVIGTED
ncbi:DinB family protein [Peribacillus alkalitolerans]|uniref:DinB family protein n=1 Tax=Peribacillus alkalitolerans TaxID=1550385 RepID=UPI0013D86AAF|nr:DinB family protein [Peribacillus alkalitolerans]